MDQATPQVPRSRRWPVLVVAGLVLAGAVSAGILVADDDRPGAAVVSAAGGRSGPVDVTSTVTVTLPVEPSTTVATSTTLSKAAVDVLNAIRGSTTTTRRPATTTTTRPPASSTTTTAPAPTTTSTTIPAPFTATLVNEHTLAVVLVVNGRNFSLAPAQTVDVELPISQRGDLVQVRLADDAKCGVTDSGVIFKPGGTYRIAIVESESMCKDVAGRIPLLRIGPK
jgi:hypothetical protein